MEGGCTLFSRAFRPFHVYARRTANRWAGGDTVWSADSGRAGGRAPANACECDIHVARTGGGVGGGGTGQGRPFIQPAAGVRPHTRGVYTRATADAARRALARDDHYTTATVTTAKTAAATTKFASVSDKCADKHATFAATRRRICTT